MQTKSADSEQPQCDRVVLTNTVTKSDEIWSSFTVRIENENCLSGEQNLLSVWCMRRAALRPAHTASSRTIQGDACRPTVLKSTAHFDSASTDDRLRALFIENSAAPRMYASTKLSVSS